ncbi:MAG: zf-HC2 domain-containing protein [Clostridiales bacterium]|nr:zf-HC2 domain-containing protein [Clostridiales bacterium]
MKLNCEVMGDLLPLYAEGLTTPATNELVEEHLADCPDCRAALEDMKQAPPPLPEDTLPLRQVRSTLQIRRRASVLLAAALVLVVALVVLARLTTPVYLGYQGNADTLVQVEELADGRYCVTFDDSVTGYRLETVETEAGKNLALVMIWYTPLDRLLGKSLQGIEQQGLLLDADTDYFYLVTPLGGAVAYCPVETWEGKIPEGSFPFAGLMPRLALNYYALIAAAAAAALGVLWLLLRKTRAGRVFRTLFWLPVAYVLAHLCIMGTDGRTYQMQWDFALIALTALAIYAALLAVWTLLPKRRGQSETPQSATPKKHSNKAHRWGAPLLAAALTLSALLAGFSWLTRPIYLSDTDLVTVSTDEEGYVSVVSFDKQVTRCRVIETFELVEEAEDPERDIYEDNLGLLLWYTPLERLLRYQAGSLMVYADRIFLYHPTYGDQLIWKKDTVRLRSGSYMATEATDLTPGLLTGLAAAVALLGLWAALQKVRAGKVCFWLFELAACFLLSFLCVTGGRFTTFTPMRDITFIVLLTVSLFAALVVAGQLRQERKE